MVEHPTEASRIVPSATLHRCKSKSKTLLTATLGARKEALPCRTASTLALLNVVVHGDEEEPLRLKSPIKTEHHSLLHEEEPIPLECPFDAEYLLGEEEEPIYLDLLSVQVLPIRRTGGDDTMVTASLAAKQRDSRDADSCADYETLINKNTCQRNAPPDYEKQTFHGRLEHIFVVWIPPELTSKIGASRTVDVVGIVCLQCLMAAMAHCSGAFLRGLGRPGLGKARVDQ
ncbi:hypothetical protein EDB19DRAFT_1822828 [Suillus lakei]|nr:hypothetical protein EDB19DRAFT_1822828 [Suillus lakei]